MQSGVLQKKTTSVAVHVRHGNNGRPTLLAGGSICSGVHAVIDRHMPPVQPSAPKKSRSARKYKRVKNLFARRLEGKSSQKHTKEQLKQTRFKGLQLIKETRFLYGAGNALVVDQQLGWYVDLAARNFQLKEKGLTLVRQNKVKYPKESNLWTKAYLFNDIAFSEQEIKKLCGLLGLRWGLSVPLDKFRLRTHPFVLTLLSFCVAKNWKPLASQLPVALKMQNKKKIWGEVGVGTRIDLLFYEEKKTANSKLWVVELKKMQNVNDQDHACRVLHKTPFMPPFNFIPRSDDGARSVLQILLGTTMLKRNYHLGNQQHRLDIQPAVLRVHTEGVSLRTIRDKWLELTEKTLLGQ